MARKRYGTERYGSVTHQELARVAADLHAPQLPVDVVARGVGQAHVRTSLPAALRVRLPDRGAATIAGRRYQVRSFKQKALNNEPVKVWILANV